MPSRVVLKANFAKTFYFNRGNSLERCEERKHYEHSLLKTIAIVTVTFNISDPMRSLLSRSIQWTIIIMFRNILHKRFFPQRNAPDFVQRSTVTEQSTLFDQMSAFFLGEYRHIFIFVTNEM